MCHVPITPKHPWVIVIKNPIFKTRSNVDFIQVDFSYADKIYIAKI